MNGLDRKSLNNGTAALEERGQRVRKKRVTREDESCSGSPSILIVHVSAALHLPLIFLSCHTLFVMSTGDPPIAKVKNDSIDFSVYPCFRQEPFSEFHPMRQCYEGT